MRNDHPAVIKKCRVTRGNLAKHYFKVMSDKRSICIHCRLILSPEDTVEFKEKVKKKKVNSRTIV